MPERKNGAQRQDERSSPSLTDKVSNLGRRLRELSDKALASGTNTLSNDEIHALISEVRGKSA